MSPAKIKTRPADKGWARNRRVVGEKYLEVADLVATEDDETINVCVGIAVLAGIAAGDAVCAVGLGESYNGPDHSAAAALLERVDKELGKKLRNLVALKPNAHYGHTLLTPAQRTQALRWASSLIEEARTRTT